RMLVDFAGGDLDGLESAQPVKADVSAENGQIEAVTVQRLASGLWRAAFVVTPKLRKPVDLRCYLTLYGEGLTETWVYQWTPCAGRVRGCATMCACAARCFSV